MFWAEPLPVSLYLHEFTSQVVEPDALTPNDVDRLARWRRTFLPSRPHDEAVARLLG
jgi:hypothetical protein